MIVTALSQIHMLLTSVTHCARYPRGRRDSLTGLMTVAVVLPSGIERGGSRERMINDGEKLELTLKWPMLLVDLKCMNKK